MYVFADCKGLKQGGALYVFADCKGRGIKCCLFDLVTERVRITFAGSKGNSVQLKIGRVYVFADCTGHAEPLYVFAHCRGFNMWRG